MLKEIFTIIEKFDYTLGNSVFHVLRHISSQWHMITVINNYCCHYHDDLWQM